MIVDLSIAGDFNEGLGDVSHIVIGILEVVLIDPELPALKERKIYQSQQALGISKVELPRCRW